MRPQTPEPQWGPTYKRSEGRRRRKGEGPTRKGRQGKGSTYKGDGRERKERGRKGRGREYPLPQSQDE